MPCPYGAGCRVSTRLPTLVSVLTGAGMVVLLAGWWGHRGAAVAIGASARERCRGLLPSRARRRCPARFSMLHSPPRPAR